MFKKFAKKIALTVNVLLFLQLAFFGLNAGAGAANATAGQDYVEPTINSIVYGGNTAVPAGLNNTLILDVSKSTNATLQTAAVNVSEDSELTAKVLGMSLEGDDAIDLIKGDNTINIADLLGSEITLSDLQTAADFLGTINVEVVVTDMAGLHTKYELVLTVKDLVKPEISNLTFAGKVATFDATSGKFAIDLNGVGNNDLATAKVAFNLSEEANIEVTSPFTYVAGVKSTGTQEVDLTTAAGKMVTYKDLKDLDIDADGIVNLAIKATDTSVEANSKVYGVDLLLDKVAPVVTMTVVPTPTNDASKVKELIFTGNESLGETNSLTLTNEVTITQGASINAGVVLKRIDNNTFKLVLADEKVVLSGTAPIKVEGTFVDLAGNEYKLDQEIKIDNAAPVAVTGLTVKYENEKAIITWTNPVENTDINFVEVRRNGEVIMSLPADAATYTDASVEKGKTYYYEVVLFDKAGNASTIARADLTVPAAKVAAVASDNAVITPAKTDDKKEVKAESSENKKTEKKNSFPAWGIILLIVLAGVGAYLYQTNKPVKSKPIAQNAPVKKSSPKKKK